MGFSVIATAVPTAIPGLYVEGSWGIQHVSPRGRVKIKKSLEAPEPGDGANILKPLGYAEFRGEDVWIWALDDPVELWIESPYALRLR